jgi:hypothetical protein
MPHYNLDDECRGLVSPSAADAPPGHCLLLTAWARQWIPFPRADQEVQTSISRASLPLQAGGGAETAFLFPHAARATAPFPYVFCVVMYAFSVGDTEFLPVQALLFVRGKWQFALRFCRPCWTQSYNQNRRE